MVWRVLQLERVLKDAEETFAKEVMKLVDGDSASFTSVPSANAGDGQREVPQDPRRHGGGCGPPDSPTGLGGVGGTPGVKPEAGGGEGSIGFGVR